MSIKVVYSVLSKNFLQPVMYQVTVQTCYCLLGPAQLCQHLRGMRGPHRLKVKDATFPCARIKF